MKYVKGTLILLAVQAAAGLGLLYSGVISVAASEPHTPAVRWILDTGKRQSVGNHADTVTLPKFALEPLTREGAASYREMCVTCHGAPGVKRSRMGKGLRPQGPDLGKTAEHTSIKELFWVVKNGIKLTGMPAWGATHSDDEIWEIVAFVETLPSLSPEEYRAMVGQTVAPTEESHEH